MMARIIPAVEQYHVRSMLSIINIVDPNSWVNRRAPQSQRTRLGGQLAAAPYDQMKATLHPGSQKGAGVVKIEPCAAHARRARDVVASQRTARPPLAQEGLRRVSTCLWAVRLVEPRWPPKA